MNLITTILCAIWPPVFLDALMQNQKENDAKFRAQASKEKNKKNKDVDFKLQMLNGPPLKSQKKELDPIN